MKTIIQITAKLSALFFISIATTSSAFATGATVIFSSANPTAVPSLSGSMLILLSLLLFIVAFKVSKQKNANPSKFFMMLIGTGILASASSGIKLVSDADAGGGAIVIEAIAIGEEIRVESEGIPFLGSNGTQSNINFSITTDETLPESVESVCSFGLTSQENLDRFEELRELFGNPDLTEEEREALQDEASSIQEQIVQTIQDVNSGETQRGTVPPEHVITISCSTPPVDNS